jgi:hypothetical protein
MSGLETLKARVAAHDQAESLNLLDAVQVIAQSGSHRPMAQWFKDFGGLRFYYGHRGGDLDRPYAEVLALTLSKDHAVHEPMQPGKPYFPNPDNAITKTELLYEYTDLDGGVTRCFRPGPWVDKVLAEAKRLSAIPVEPQETDVTQHFAPYEGK